MTAAFTPPAGKEVLGHPRGLWYLVFAEAWERFSYYGMQALLVLYLTQYLLLPENVAHVARRLIDSLTTTAQPRDRDEVAAQARARSAERFGRTPAR